MGALTFTLPSGSYDTAIACLVPGTTYTPYACGDNYPSEVSWSVGGIYEGASSNCTGGNESFNAQVPSPAPTVTFNPTTLPTLKPTLSPTHNPTVTSGVTNADEFNIAASLSYSVLRLDTDIELSSAGLLVSDVTNVVVHGAGRLLKSSSDDSDGTIFYSEFKGYSLEIIRSDVEISDLTIKGGVFSGLYHYESIVTLNQVSFYRCSRGSALFIHQSSTVMNDVLFQDNSGMNNTMVIYKAYSIVMKHIQFTSNTRALSVDSTGEDDAPVLLTNVAFALNSRALAIHGSTVSLRYAQFEDNYNAMQVLDADALPSSVTLYSVSFARNAGSRYGAIILKSEYLSTITMTSVTFSQNQATGDPKYDDDSVSDGAALYISGGEVTASDLVFYDNIPTDTYSAGENNLECTAAACTDGTEVVTATGGNCLSCGPCDALRKGLVTMCSPCGAGEYSPRNASLKASCLECGGGNRSLSGTNTSCTLSECPVGSFGVDEATYQLYLSTDKYEPLDLFKCKICQNGYATYMAGLSVCSKCQFFEWCPADGLCIEGHTGFGCAECEPNWYMKSNTCLQCPNTAGLDLALLFVVAAFMVFVLYRLAGAEDEEGGNDIEAKMEGIVDLAAAAVAKFNVILSFFQITTLVFFSFSIEFPVNLLNWLSWIALSLSFDFVELGRPECSMGVSMGFASRWYIKMFAPFTLMVPFAILAKYQARYQEDNSQTLATIVLIGTSSYVPILGSALIVWRCEETDYGDSVLAAAPSIRCNADSGLQDMRIVSMFACILYLLYTHGAIPKFAKEGNIKVRRIYEQDFGEGRKWWFHATLGYKLATLFVAAIVPDALTQLTCMLVLSSSMALLCFVFKPHIILDKNTQKNDHWDDECSQWIAFQCTTCCVIPAVVLTLDLLGEIHFLNMIALLLFLPIFGLATCYIKCYHDHVFADGFSTNNVETILHTTEAAIVFVAYLYETASKKNLHPNKQLTDEPNDGDDTYYDENGDYISNDERFVEVILTCIYLFSVALSTFEMARIFNPMQYLKDWIFGEADPVFELTQKISGVIEKKTTSSEANKVVTPNPLQAGAEVELVVSYDDVYKG